jgi:hypothetical protein
VAKVTATKSMMVSFSSTSCCHRRHQLPSLLLALGACCASAVASREGRGELSGDPAAAAIADALSRLVLGVAEALMASLMRFCNGAVLLFLHGTEAAEVTSKAEADFGQAGLSVCKRSLAALVAAQDKLPATMATMARKQDGTASTRCVYSKSRAWHVWRAAGRTVA